MTHGGQLPPSSQRLLFGAALCWIRGTAFLRVVKNLQVVFGSGMQEVDSKE